MTYCGVCRRFLVCGFLALGPLPRYAPPMRCPTCSEDNPDRAKFCLNCATPLDQPIGLQREVRKTVTIVFSDVTGSTAIGERLDPETLRRVMERYFDRMREAIERHGGTVEKFIGDAVMAVFGIPKVHEDDALRAVRAAVAMRRALEELNEAFSRDHDVRIAVRTGVHTGEVVAGEGLDRQRLVTGDAVNVAARLEQVAASGDILLGLETFRLVRDAVQVEELSPLELKGKAEPVRAYRLVGLEAAAPGIARRLDTSFVGRIRERGLLRDAYARAVGDRSSYLLTILGIAGVGKSRLVAKVTDELGGECAVASGRCLPYGDGITFWPVLEVLKSSAGIAEANEPEEVRSRLRQALAGEEDAEAVEAKLSALLGLVTQPGSIEETFWAVRRYLEALARERPLIVVIDDLHWGEPALLDLIEHVADWSRDAPILLVCLARPEFLDKRPGWGGGKMNAASILLEPLDEGEASSLVESLLGRAELNGEVVSKIVRAAEGNPLFVEELLAMLLDDGSLLLTEDGRWAQSRPLDRMELPSSVQALLAARLDRLEPHELSLVEGGAVVGQVFYRGAVTELAPESLRPDVGTYLKSLVRKDLVRPERGGFPGDESYRFRHILIRDAAYRAMVKETRAELHERFADWLERVAGDRFAEYEEILGYHLEQAHRYRAELGQAADERTASLAQRAARALSSSGRRAQSRGDMRATANLLTRAIELLPVHAVERLELLPPLSEALAEAGRDADVKRLLDEGLRVAAGDARITAHLRLARRELVDDSTNLDKPWEDLAEPEARAAVDVFREAEDEAGLTTAWRVLGNVHWGRGHITAAREAWRNAAEHARSTGDRGQEAQSLVWDLIAQDFDSTPAPEGLERAKETLDHLKDLPGAKAQVLWEFATFNAMLGHLDEARAAFETSQEIERDLGRDVTANHYGPQVAQEIERLAGQPDARIDVLRMGIDAFERASGERNALLIALLSEALAGAGQDDEAWVCAQEARALSAGRAMHVEPMWQQAAALVLARRGQLEQAEALAQEAVLRLRATEFMWKTADALARLAVVCRLSGRQADAAVLFREAQRLYEEKGIIRLAEGTQRLLAESADA
jgi:class 3 adenylate cyclase